MGQVIMEMRYRRRRGPVYLFETACFWDGFECFKYAYLHIIILKRR